VQQAAQDGHAERHRDSSSMLVAAEWHPWLQADTERRIKLLILDLPGLTMSLLCTLLAVASAALARVAAPVRAAPSMAGAAEHLDEGNARFIIQGFCVCA
jgi:hypothetical protein